MRTDFVDTAAWLALLNASDAHHQRAKSIMWGLRSDKAALLTTEFVLVEVANSLSAPPARARTIAFMEGLKNLAVLEVIAASAQLFGEGWSVYRKHRDKEWSLTDCTSFSIMRQRGLIKAFTPDHHFTQAGFEKLL